MQNAVREIQELSENKNLCYRNTNAVRKIQELSEIKNLCYRNTKHRQRNTETV